MLFTQIRPGKKTRLLLFHSFSSHILLWSFSAGTWRAFYGKPAALSSFTAPQCTVLSTRPPRMSKVSVPSSSQTSVVRPANYHIGLTVNSMLEHAKLTERQPLGLAHKPNSNYYCIWVILRHNQCDNEDLSRVFFLFVSVDWQNGNCGNHCLVNLICVPATLLTPFSEKHPFALQCSLELNVSVRKIAQMSK